MNKKHVGYAVLALAVLGGSSLGVLSNFLIPTPESQPVMHSSPFKKHHNRLPIRSVKNKDLEKEEAPKDQPEFEEEQPRTRIFTLNAWRFQINFLIFLCLLPVLAIFERQRRKYDRIRSYLKILQSGRLKGKATFQFLNEEEIATLQHKMMRGDEEDIKRLVEFAELHHQKTQIDKSARASEQMPPSQQSRDTADTAMSFIQLRRRIGPMTFYLNLVTLTVIAATLQVVWQYVRVSSSLQTTQSHVFTLSNLHGLLVVPLLYLSKKEVHRFELAGFLIGAIGVTLMLVDPEVLRADGIETSHFTDLILLASNFAALPMFVLTKSLIRKRLLSHLFLINVLTMLIFCLCAVLLEGASMDSNPHKGLFGWSSYGDQFTVVILFGLGATFWGSAVGYTLIMRFWSPITCMNLLMMEPIAAQIYGLAAGIDDWPAHLTILGVFVIILGLFLANKGLELRLKDKEHASMQEQDYRQEIEDLGFENEEELIGEVSALDESVNQIRKMSKMQEGGERSMADLVREQSKRHDQTGSDENGVGITAIYGMDSGSKAKHAGRQ